MTDKIEVHVPGPDEPGYLRRMKLLAAVQVKIKSDEREFGANSIAPSTMDAIAELLGPYLVVPEGVDPVEAVWDLSQDQYMSAMDALGGKMTVPKEQGQDLPEPTPES